MVKPDTICSDLIYPTALKTIQSCFQFKEFIVFVLFVFVKNVIFVKV